MNQMSDYTFVRSVSPRVERILTATLDDILPESDFPPEARDKVVTELLSDINFILSRYHGFCDSQGYPQPKALGGYFHSLAHERNEERGLMPKVGSYLLGIAVQLEMLTRPAQGTPEDRNIYK